MTIDEKIEKIKEAKYNGVRKIEVGEDLIEFRKVEDYDKLLNDLEREKSLTNNNKYKNVVLCQGDTFR